MAAIRKGLCGAQEAANCFDEYGESGIEWACKNCPKKKFEDLHEYTIKIYKNALLQRGGYPLEKNDLTLEEWFDLGRMRDVLEPQTGCPMMGGK